MSLNTDTTMPVVPAYGGYGNNGGMFGNDWAWIVLFILFGGWGGRGFGGQGMMGGAPCATQADVRSAVDQQTLISKLDQQTYGLADSTYALNNTMVNGFHGVDNAVCNLGYNVQAGFNQLGHQISDCCCTTQRAIDGVNYNLATQACDTRNLIQNVARDITDNANIWYECDSKGGAITDSNGNLVPVYSSRAEAEGAPYYSIRIASDPGNYIYSTAKSGSVQARICYYNYYQYLNGMEPSYVFGTDALGRDLFAAIGKGARFSILFAVMVSAINLTIGAFYGAVQGYYGGWIDMVLDRISDILSGIPFVVVTTLFQLHLAQKVGVVPSFLFAFVLTGWIGMSALTRKQFYRFKSQEFVMAARTLGASDGRLMFKHIFPNGLGTIITSWALVIPGAISSETSMTYLGIVDLNSYAGATIGTLLSAGQASMTEAPHTMLWPSLFFALLMISFNLFGNGLRDAFNPSTRGAED